MKCDELKVYHCNEWHNEYTEFCLKSDVDAAIAELKDKCQMHDFFWEGCGFAKRGFKNTIAVSEAFDKLEAENAELKQKLEDVNELIKTARQMLEDAKATHYAEMVDAGMRERKLKRALWLARAERYKIKEFIAREEGNLSNQMSWSRILRERTYNQWVGQLLRIANLANKLQNKCLAKAEAYR